MKKSIFIHKPKTAGVYVLSRLEAATYERYLIFNGWKLKTREDKYDKYLGKDLNTQDLNKIASFELDDIKQIVHIHSTNLSTNDFNKFENNNWFSFMFHRNPLDTISSAVIYFCLEKHYNITEKADINKKIDEHMEYFIYNDDSWKLPAYWKRIDWIGLPTEENFHKLFDILQLTYTPSEKLNISSNEGYDYYLQNGYISEKTHKKIISHPDFIEQQRLYEKLLSR